MWILTQFSRVAGWNIGREIPEAILEASPGRWPGRVLRPLAGRSAASRLALQATDFAP